MFIESNPVPAKTTLSLMGKCRADVRLPLVGISAGSLEKLKAVLATYKLI
jgi:4-hydroxy-tetrahydrodipicolinate synthase